MRHAVSLSALALAAVLALGDALAEDGAPTLIIEDHVGRLFIETAADITTFEVVVDPGEGVLPSPGTTVEGAVTRVEGEALGNVNCKARDGQVQLKHDGDWRPIKAYPTIRVRAPLTTHVEVRDSLIVGEIGDVGAADVTVNGCGAVTLGDVAGAAQLSVNGSGDLIVGAVGGALQAYVNGSGDMTVGDAASAEAAVNGSGELAIGAVAGAGSFQVNGSGDLEAASVDGELDAAVAGSGDIRIANGRTPLAQLSTLGSGDVWFGGAAEDVEARMIGSGDIYVRSATGSIDVSDTGVGDFTISDR